MENNNIHSMNNILDTTLNKLENHLNNTTDLLQNIRKNLVYIRTHQYLIHSLTPNENFVETLEVLDEFIKGVYDEFTHLNLIEIPKVKKIVDFKIQQIQKTNKGNVK